MQLAVEHGHLALPEGLKYQYYKLGFYIGIYYCGLGQVLIIEGLGPSARAVGSELRGMLEQMADCTAVVFCLS